MKKQLQITLGALAMLLLPFSVSAQGDISSLFKAGITDLGTIANGYMRPAGNGFAASLGSNWYNTAATHSALGFDLTFGASLSFVPTADQTFDLSTLQNLRPVNPAITTAPTFGGKGDGVELTFKNAVNGVSPSNFTTPAGVTRFVPAVNLQFAVGLPLGNDVTFRYAPTLKNNGMNVSLWGIGLKHNIKQWIPVVNMMPFDASVFLGYTKFKQDYLFPSQLTAADLVNPSLLSSTDYSGSKNQGFSMNIDALVANLIISKSLLFFTPYIGVGITRTNFDFGFDGSYPVLGNPSPKIPVVYVDGANIAKVSSSETMLGTTVGFRMKLFFITALHAQYTFQKYPTASVGFGINFR